MLNPGGVRIGTAEIYRQVEQLPDVVESLVIGQQWQGDERIVLFVRLRDGLSLDQARVDHIRAHIRRNTTPRHVPARIVQVTDIPRTKSGKIVELAVRDVVHGRAVKNREALANPEALDQFTNRVELRDLMDDAVILSACRTPIGSFGGVFKDLSAADLGAVVIREAIDARRRQGDGPRRRHHGLRAPGRRRHERRPSGRAQGRRAGRSARRDDQPGAAAPGCRPSCTGSRRSRPGSSI